MGIPVILNPFPRDYSKIKRGGGGIMQWEPFLGPLDYTPSGHGHKVTIFLLVSKKPPTNRQIGKLCDFQKLLANLYGTRTIKIFKTLFLANHTKLK